MINLATNNFSEKANFIWSVADLIRGPYRPNQYTDVMLPLTVLRRLDCVLELTKDKVLARQKELAGGKVKNIEPILCRVSGNGRMTSLPQLIDWAHNSVLFRLRKR